MTALEVTREGVTISTADQEPLGLTTVSSVYRSGLNTIDDLQKRKRQGKLPIPFRTNWWWFPAKFRITSLQIDGRKVELQEETNPFLPPQLNFRFYTIGSPNTHSVTKSDLFIDQISLGWDGSLRYAGNEGVLHVVSNPATLTDLLGDCRSVIDQFKVYLPNSQ